MFQLITKLQESGYEVAFDAKQEGEKRFLVSLIQAHRSAIDLACKFPKVVTLDVTYKTNKHQMPFVNVVGTGNIGYPSLKTWCIAGGWVSWETNEKLRDIVWPSNQPISPQTFVTDSADPLTKALDKVFPDSKKVLCKIHIRRNFQTKLQKLFDTKEDYEELEKAINFLMADQYIDKFSNMCVVPDEKLEMKALAKYKEIAQKSKKPEEVIKYLNE